MPMYCVLLIDVYVCIVFVLSRLVEKYCVSLCLLFVSRIFGWLLLNNVNLIVSEKED